MIVRLLLLALLIAGISSATERPKLWTYESLREHFESRKTAQEKYQAIHLLDTAFEAVIIRKDVAEADRIKLLRIFIKDEDRSVRTVAVDAITFNEWGAEFSKELIAMLAGDPPKMTISAVAKAMGVSGAQLFTPHLVKLLDHPDPGLQLEVAGRLSLLNPKLGFKFLAPRITDSKRELDQRLAALRQLPRKPTPGIVRLLTGQTKAPEPELRRAATERLGYFYSSTHAPTFIKLLTDEDARVRGLAAQGLARMEDRTEAHEDAIATLLKDPEPFVRHTAADALRTIKAKRFLPEIKGLLDDPDELVRRRARIVVYFLSKDDKGDEKK